jgi:hypothetical protein
MRRSIRVGLAGALSLLLVVQAGAEARSEKGGTDDGSASSNVLAGTNRAAPAVIKVPPPTGDPVTDRQNIEAAIARAVPGDILRFEHFIFALVLGSADPGPGGYTVEGNVFKNVVIGNLVTVLSRDVTRIAHNEFINVGEPFDHAGGVLHFVGNVNRAPNPELVPVLQQPFNGGVVLGFPDLPCNDNVIENNDTFGNADGFIIAAINATCRRNIIRNNRFFNQTRFTEADAGTLAILQALESAPILENTVVEGNLLDGTSGVGIFGFRVLNSSLVGNAIHGVRRAVDLPPGLARGGTAILLGGDSRGNAIASNRLTDNEVCDVWLQRNTVNNVVVEPTDTVLDRGRRNQVLSAGSCGADASALEAEAAEERFLSGKLELILRMRGRK